MVCNVSNEWRERRKKRPLHFEICLMYFSSFGVYADVISCWEMKSVAASVTSSRRNILRAKSTRAHMNMLNVLCNDKCGVNWIFDSLLCLPCKCVYVWLREMFWCQCVMKWHACFDACLVFNLPTWYHTRSHQHSHTAWGKLNKILQHTHTRWQKRQQLICYSCKWFLHHSATISFNLSTHCIWKMKKNSLKLAHTCHHSLPSHFG